ncbi:MAG: hypothetical protein HUU29_14160, partial [Planctomycetaceae bacterium]|nr:hypothetical protein [Planctomycetaceae bacterium]
MENRKEGAGMSGEPDIASYAEGLRERLRHLLQGVPQRELARRLGIPNQSFNRYFHGTMPPAWLCSHIVSVLGVNPSWLLTGEGEAFLADINAGNKQTAENLLELVQAMNSVAKMRLGALTGKQHYKVLRELNDAFLQLEDLRAKINVNTLPVFQQIYKDLWKALETNDLDRAASLVTAGDQVSRICDDAQCRRGFSYLKSAYLYKFGDIDGFVRQLHEVVRLYAMEGEHPDDAGWKRIGSFMIALLSSWRGRQARSLCDAYLGLSHDSQAPRAAIDYLKSWSGYFDLEAGEWEIGQLKIGEAFRSSQQWDLSRPEALPTNVERVRQILKMHLWTSMYYSRTISVREMLAAECSSNFKVTFLAPVLCWERDPDVLSDFITSLERAEMDEQEASSPAFKALRALTFEQFSRMRRVLEAKRANSSKTGGKALQPGASSSEEVRLFADLMNAEVATLSGASREAAALVLANDARLHGATNLTPPLLFRAMHYRNVLETMPRPSASQRDAVRRAKRFFENHLSKSYHCF